MTPSPGAQGEHLVDMLTRFLSRTSRRPLAIALDGRSGSGKSSLSAKLAKQFELALVEGDDFYAGGVALRSDSPAQRAASCIDWRRQADVLRQLRSGHPASWHAFDWEAFDGRLEPLPKTVRPGPLILCEGVYSGRPELASLFDLRILLQVPDEERLRRLRDREGEIGAWERQWHEAEDWYFTQVAQPACFDRVLSG